MAKRGEKEAKHRGQVQTERQITGRGAGRRGTQVPRQPPPPPHQPSIINDYYRRWINRQEGGQNRLC